MVERVLNRYAFTPSVVEKAIIRRKKRDARDPLSRETLSGDQGCRQMDGVIGAQRIMLCQSLRDCERVQVYP